MSYGVDTDANGVYTSLLNGVTVTVPNTDLTDPKFQIPGDASSDMYQAIAHLTNADLTSGSVSGSGTFDVMMQGMKAQLQNEFDKGRITGAEYTKAYVALTQSTMQFAVQYLLGRDQAYWQAVIAQAQAVTARVGLETAKIEAATAKLAAENGKATLALTKAKIGTEDVQFGQAKFQVDNLLPAQLALTNSQKSQVDAQVQVTNKQVTLVSEQAEAARGQTLDVRTDGQVVTGSVGKQKALYDQQITSYKRDAETKFAKMIGDSWITQKTVDDGLTAPDSFTNASLDTVFTALKNNLALG
jgi:hypothetical protein